VRAIALALTALTGFSGLVYEVAWQKYLATLLGSHSEATAAVLALFLGGLSLGYALFGRVTRAELERARAAGRAPRLLLLYGAVEASIGTHALLFPLLFRAVRALSFAIPHRPGGAGFALDVALSALLILPPTVLMGGTIPILTQALARSLADATRIHAFVYACNTAGAFVGALAGGLFLIPWLGLERVVLAMGAVNLAAGSAFGALGLRHRHALAAPDAPAPGAPPAIGAYAAVAALVGFAAMTLETVLIRLGGLSLGSSAFTFAMVVAVFVLCIALGSFAVSALPRIGPTLLVAAQWALAALLAGLYPLLPDGPYAAHVVRTLFRDTEQAFYPYQIAIFLGALGVLALPVGLSGATLPLLFHQLRREVGDLGAAAGRLYAWNTVGSLAGALLGGYLLFYWLDLDQVYRVALGAVVAAATLLSIRLLALPRLATLALLALPLLAGVASMPAWNRDYLASGTFRSRSPIAGVSYAGAKRFYGDFRQGTRIVYYKDDPNTSVTAFEARLADGRLDTAIATNAKVDGSIRGDYPTMGLLALLPALFVEHPRNAFVIGYGTGVTVGELGALDSMQSVTVAEISPGVIGAAPYFERWNQGALANPKTHVVISDAYRALLRSDQRYDIIVSEPSNPWVTGVEMLYSREFLSAARDRLAPGGVYAQWIHLYETDSAVVELVLRTYASVFEHVAVWYTIGTDLVLLGFQSPDGALDLDRLAARAATPEIAAGLKRAGIDSFPALLAHELLPLGVVNAAPFHGDIQTLLHPVLSQRAARAFFRGATASVPSTAQPDPAAVGAGNSLLRRYARLSGGLSDGTYQQVVEEACNHDPVQCPTFMAGWMRDVPSSPARDALLEQHRAEPLFAPHLRAPRLRELALLLGDGASLDEPVTPDRAKALTDLYVNYYQHAMPFSRELLARQWRVCQPAQPGDGSCASGLAAAEARVGPLRGQRASAAPSAPGALR